MARYTGPKSKVARRFREPIFGPDKSVERKNYPPGIKKRKSVTIEKRFKMGKFVLAQMKIFD